MVENPYSDRIKDFIISWAEKYNQKFNITKIYEKNKSLFQIGLPGKKKIDYKPDGAYILDRKDTIIFEVIDSQVKTKTIADVVRCIFNQNITDLIIIVKNKQSLQSSLKTSDTLLELFDDILTLLGDGKKKKETPLNVHFIEVTEIDSQNEKKIEEKFNRKLPKVFKA